MIYTIAQLADTAQTMIDAEKLDPSMFIGFSDGENPLVEDLQYLMSEAGEPFIADLAAHGLKIDRELWTVEVVDPAAVDYLESLTETILAEYESSGPAPTWVRLELSGDDDVDYHGGYWGPLIDILRYVRS